MQTISKIEIIESKGDKHIVRVTFKSKKYKWFKPYYVEHTEDFYVEYWITMFDNFKITNYLSGVDVSEYSNLGQAISNYIKFNT